MAESNAETSVAARLGQLLDRGLLPAGGPAEAAERLIERLERPARVALLGLPGSGKSAILNLLAGTVVVPETLRLPSIVVQYGAVSRMVCTLANGRVETVAGRDLGEVLTLNPALVTMELDLPSLKVISLMEVSAGPMEAEQRRAAIWASKRADIVIWCTTSYLPKEQVVWETMPDVVKDNGFLFLTKVDLLGSREAAEGMLERVEMRAGEDFRQVLSISAKLARAAMPAGGAVDRDMFRDSGAAAVITAIKSRVQAARRADLDTAELLLARQAEADGTAARRSGEAGPVEEPEPPQWVPPPDPVEAVKPADAPLPEIAQAVVEKLAASPPPARAKPERRPAPPAPTEPELSVAGAKRFSDRIKQLPLPDEGAAAPRVPPLRTTWKSRAEPAKAVPPAVEVAPEPPEPVAVEEPPAAAPEPEAETTNDGPDEDRIAAMLSAVARAPAEPRVPRQRARIAEPEVAKPGPSAGADRRTLFAPRAAAPVAPAPSPRQTEPLNRVRAPASGPRAVSSIPVSAPEDLASPRAAMLRARQPDPGAGERRERPRIAARAPVAVAQPAETTAQPVSQAEQELLDAAIRLIVARSTELAAGIDLNDKPPVDTILDHARETTEQVRDLLARSASSGVRRINADLGEVLDLILLMQLEKGHAPADDALTLLLQIRRDLETLRAA